MLLIYFVQESLLVDQSARWVKELLIKRIVLHFVSVGLWFLVVAPARIVEHVGGEWPLIYWRPRDDFG